MSCNKLNDLEDLAVDLFQFGEGDDNVMRPRKEKQVKASKKKHKQNHQEQAKEDEHYEPLLADKPLGTHNIFVKTFGCSHNISDTEFMVGQLSDYGYNIVDTSEEADLVLINSCTVVNPSQDAFISMVCKAKKIKKPIVVAGCVPQGDQAIPELSQVSAIGVTQIDRVVQVVEETLKGHKVQLMTKKQLPSLDLPKVRKNKDIEIIPINAGCLGSCTYCKTVFARGRLLSYASDAITSRVRSVCKEGVMEIWLTSEDTGAYGRDIDSNISELLISLCEQLQGHDNIMMRIGMTNPPYMLSHLKTIAHFLNHPRVFSFIHVPVQAGNNTVLQKMNREYTVQEFKQVTDFFLEHVPDVTIATDIICGFAEETQEEFEDTLELIRDYKFRVVNINQFYLRPGTPAAHLKQVSSKAKKIRSGKLTQLFHSYQHHSYMMNRVERIWINETETHKGEMFLVAHTKNYTKVMLPYEQELLYTQCMIRITKCYQWHIQGEIIERNAESVKVDPGYVNMMKKDLVNETADLKEKKEKKLQQLKQQKLQQRLKEEPQGQILMKKTQKENENSEKSSEVQIQQTRPRYEYLGVAVLLLVLAGILHLSGY